MQFFLSSVLLFVISTAGSDLTGPVCDKQETYPVDVKIPTSIPFRVKTFAWCFKPPSFRCAKERTAYRTSYKTETKMITKTIVSCCDGYSNRSNVCMPNCDQDCIHGICSSPNQCKCEPGFNGNSCQTACVDLSWGQDCQNKCYCKNSGTCDPKSGSCQCVAGYYGPDCGNLCNCLSDDYVCNSTIGCVCKLGFLGVNCSYPDPNINSLAYSITQLDEASSENNGMTIAALCLLVIAIISLSIFVILRYKTKVNKLQNELNYVSYSVDPPQDRFENPIYSYQSSSSGLKTDNTIINNRSFLNNDLTCKNNIEKAKLKDLEIEGFGACKATEDHLDSVCRGAGNEFNPNIYNSIDDFKMFSNKEPIYDEIKPREEETPSESYDELTYDMPRTVVRSFFDDSEPLKSSMDHA